MSELVRWLVLLVFALIPCAAEAQQVHLDWKAPSGRMCPRGPTLSADVEQLTGQRFVKDVADADVRVVGRIERTELGVVAHLEAHTADGTPLGTRELRAAGENCASLRRPLAMVLSLLLGQPLTSRGRAPVTLALGAELAAHTQLLPRTSGGVGLLGMVQLRSWLRLRAALSYWWPVVAETARGEGAKMQAAGAALALCPRLLGSQPAFWLCLGGQAGRSFARARGLSNDARDTMGFADVSLELAGSWQLSRRSALWVAGGPLASLVRPELYFTRVDGSRVQIQRASPLGAIFRVGLTIGAR